MPKQLFTAAACEKCGGALNLSTLQCEYCHTPHVFDLGRAIPYPAENLPNNQYFRLRDRRTDALLLSLIQPAFAAAGIEPALSLQADSLHSTMTVMGTVPFDGQRLVVGEIAFYAADQHSCTIIPVNRHHQGGPRKEIRWEINLLEDGRFYFLDSWLSTSSFKGEHELASSEELAGFVTEIVKPVVECDTARRQYDEERRREATKRPGILAKLFGAGD